MKLYIATVVVWVALALTTLWFVIEDSSSLTAALVAWLGGIITARLAEQTYMLWRHRNTEA